MRVISADSSAAILDEKFMPLRLVASASVLVNPPYREPQCRLAEPIFKEMEDSYEVIVHEAELCRDLLDKVKADVVHLDMSLDAISLEELSPVQLSNMRISTRARQHILKVLPKLRKIAGEIRRKQGIEVLAIGKESIPVRVAELTSGAEAILFACAKVVEEKQPVLLGLPSKCQYRIADGKVYLYSLMAAEHDVRGFAEDASGVLKKVNILETLNPCARGFRALKIRPLS
ncbi:MAG: DUF4152 family protein [Candidatus Bathyarchaeota archaeon]|nr:DUF4152 family protein [Candidatus Bathyarchaeota archaeon]